MTPFLPSSPMSVTSITRQWLYVSSVYFFFPLLLNGCPHQSYISSLSYASSLLTLQNFTHKYLFNWIRCKGIWISHSGAQGLSFPCSVPPAYTLDFFEAMIINTIISSSSPGYFLLKWRRKELDEHLAARTASMPAEVLNRQTPWGVCGWWWIEMGGGLWFPTIESASSGGTLML